MNIKQNSDLCLTAKLDNPWLWPKRFCHMNSELINKLSKHELVRCLPKINYKIDNLCDAYQIGKLKRCSFVTS